MIEGAKPWEARGSERDKVFHRTQGIVAAGAATGGATTIMTLVDISDGGFMVRCDADAAQGDRVSIDLPIVGRIAAEVRWALGGRIGCRFDRSIPADDYAALLPLLGTG